jgi:3'(2'), 5'-bisphosphate nucleotidase
MVPADASAHGDLSLAARRSLADAFGQLCLDAASAIMQAYEAGCRVRTKADASPVSEADERAEAIILAGLPHCAPGIPVLAEEAASRGVKPDVDGRFILVDPLDGTREFLSRNGEFTVNIALVDCGRPVAGAVYAPVLNRLWLAADTASVLDVAPGQRLAEGREARAIRCRPAPAALVAVASRSHCDAETEAFLARLPVGERRSAGSSLKFCLVAEGLADVYPRFGPTMEWDTAAGDAVLRAAGGNVLSLSGEPMRYGKVESGFRNGGFVAWGDAGLAIPAA